MKRLPRGGLAAALLPLWSLTVHAAVTISPSTLPDWTVQMPYSQKLTAHGCTIPCTWSTSGSIPAGLSLDAASGVLSGVPGTAGQFTFTATASNLLQSGSLTYVLRINPLPSITTASLASGQVGTAYSQTIAVSGGTAPYQFSISAGTPPAGLSLDGAKGILSGTPSAVGSFKLTIAVEDQASAATSQSYTLEIAAAGGVGITSGAALPSGTVGSAYRVVLTASGGAAPYSWSLTAGTLPGGISLTPGGILSGTPTAAGTFGFTLKATDSRGATATRDFTLTVASASQQLTITTTSLPNGSTAATYSQTLAASGGSSPYSWSISGGALPPGLSLNGTTGAITGTPSTTGSFAFTARVADQTATVADRPLSIDVTAAPTLTFTGVSSTANSAQQITFGLTLSTAYPRAITGSVTLTFQPNAKASADDPAIQFASGGRSVTFTVPPNTTQAVFSATPVAFQTGTVAGTITLAVTSDLSGGSFQQTVTIAPAAPVIQSATVVPNSSGFSVQVSGFSNSRDLTSASFHFTATSGQVVQTSDLTVPLSTAANQWYSGSASQPFGGQYQIVVPFTLQKGVVSGLASVSVELQNQQNTSAPVSASF